MLETKNCLSNNYSYQYVIFFLLIIFSCYYSWSQVDTENHRIDSLSQLNYKTLKRNIIEGDSIFSFQNIQAYIKKGKRQKDTLSILRGYHFYVICSDNSNINLRYCDSIIAISDEENYRSKYLVGIFLKSQQLYNLNDYENSLNNYIRLKQINKSKEYNEDLDILIDVNIGTIKNRLGNYQESLELFLKGYNFYNRSKEYDYANPILHSIVDAFCNLKEKDSAIKYNNLLLKQINSTNKDELYPYYLLSESVISFNNQNFNRSIEYAEKSIPGLLLNKDLGNLMFSYYYIGKSNKYENKMDKSIYYLKQMDSLFIKTKDIHPTLRDAYHILIDEFKIRKDVENELIYINRLLTVDSFISKNYKSLSKKIFLEYDTPRFLESKEKTIKRIKKENETSNALLKILFFILFIVSIISAFVFYDNQKNRKKFKLLIEKNNSANVESKNKSINQISESELKISKDIIDDILSKIELFENEVKFINPKLTVGELSKEFGTNQKYLSKIIHKHKGKKFSDYINSLRIDYAIELLKNDYKKYKKYTIKGIANEVGFNSRDSFSAAFVKNTGIRPSYFLKQLKK